MASNSKADELERRLVQFAIDIVKVIGELPKNSEGKHVAAQLLRSGTAAAPNYGEARAAESRADFVHKVKIALKELNETAIWLRILRGSFAVQPDFARYAACGISATMPSLSLCRVRQLQ